MQKKSGFTLIELLVVIAIIGILAGIVAPKLFGGMDSAKEQQCRNNLRQLQAAVIHQALDSSNGRLPYANGFEFWGNGEPDGKNGWVAWVPDDLNHPLSWHKGGYGGTAQEPTFSDDLGIGDPKNDGFPSRWAIRNGTLWDYVKNESCYACPVTKRLKDTWMDLDPDDPDSMKKWEVYRTYVMNAYFGGAFIRRGWGAAELYLSLMGTADERTLTDHSGWQNPKSADTFVHHPEASRLMLFSEGLPSPNGKNSSKRRQKTGDITISPYDPAMYPARVSDVAVYSKGISWRGRGNILMGFPKTEMLCGLHEPLVLYRPAGTDEAPVYLGSALAVFFDGHIEKVSPVYETSDGVADKPVNSAWFLCHGLRPAEEAPVAK